MSKIYELLLKFSEVEDEAINEVRKRGEATVKIPNVISDFYTLCGFCCLLEKAIKRKHGLNVECHFMLFHFENKLLVFIKEKNSKKPQQGGLLGFSNVHNNN